ncbi:MFS transporter [Caballeronia sp. LZ029]|uniref:MFS transporter n=1 Tax=Caballeronia sp. LZ029 TaxID=3038564 RepID=UPI00285752E8|nr:MFS transporter [Caballeronia sp. LZ029]MDR5744756.1 MFS transporter [Caballeronia sp. LZ029]
MNKPILMEDLPLRRFHLRVAFAGTGGVFSDGFVLGIVGIAVSIAAVPLHLSAFWMGLLGAASLIGLFLGSLIAGPLADRFGRRWIFGYDMVLFALVSGAQYFVTSPTELFIFRILLGVILGADYVVGKALIVEYVPRRYRGRLLSMLSIAWASGYVSAYIVGLLLKDVAPDSWRLMLALSGVPALLIFPFRLGIPESPLWLIKKSRAAEAAAIILKKFGANVTATVAPVSNAIDKRASFSTLFSARLRRNTFVGCVFFTCQVIPYFALGTFTPKVLESLNVHDNYLGAVVYNILLIVGSMIGLTIIDRIPRRVFLTGSFYLCGAILFALASFSQSTILTILLFGLFACVLSGAANLEYVYTPELFPTELRASGVGVVIACSRLGSAAATFLLPISVQQFGIRESLFFCVGTLIIGGIVCQLFAPETRNAGLMSEPEPVSNPGHVALEVRAGKQ